MLLALLSVLMMSTTADSFCPYGCGCDETNSRVTCIKADLEVMPISLNPSIHSLILRYNQFHTVDASFNFYPELELVDLSHNQLFSIPDRAFKAQGRLRDLRLHNNKLAALRHLTFSGLRSLHTLDLRHNLLESVPAQAFSDLLNLELLDLSHNQIGDIDEAAFDSLASTPSNLKILRLEANRLSAVPIAALSRLTGLVELQLSGNNLVTLPDGSFSGLGRLNHLDLSGNQLEKLHERSFVGLEALTSLQLNNNALYELASKVLQPLSGSLRELWLGQNRFAALSTDWLVDVPHLQQLDVSNCPELRSISSEAFSANAELESVVIAGNPLLADLHPAAFRGLTAIHRLDLSNNGLMVIPEALVHWDTVNYLQVSGNPLACSCAANYFLKAVIIRSALNSSEAVRVVRCWTPLQLRDVDLARLDLDCDATAAGDEDNFALVGNSGRQEASLSTVAGLAAAATVVLVVCTVLLVRWLYPAACLLLGGNRRQHAVESSPLPAKDILQYDGVVSASGSEPRYVSPHYTAPRHQTLRPYLVNIVTNPYEERKAVVGGGDKGDRGAPPAFYYYTTDRRQAAVLEQPYADPRVSCDAGASFSSASAAGTLREPLYYAVSSGNNNNSCDQSTTTLLKIDTSYEYRPY